MHWLLEPIETDDSTYNRARQAFDTARHRQARAVINSVKGRGDDREQEAAEKASQQAVRELADARYRLGRNIIGDILSIEPGTLIDAPE